MQSLFAARPAAADLPARFARAARVALVGLVAPPALFGLASMLGAPIRSGVDTVIWVFSLAGFAGAGWMAGRSLRPARRMAAAATLAFLAGGTFITPAFHGLEGLTGREPVSLVAGATVGQFGLGFGVAGTLVAVFAGLRRRRLWRAAALSALAGCLGGALALLPYAWKQIGLSGVGAGYMQMALAVVGFLGCLIIPFRLTGLALAPPGGHASPHEPESADEPS